MSYNKMSNMYPQSHYLFLFQDRKITKTSFLDDSFRKNLESALRFGNPLLVQDVENYDPILNPVLNKELKRTGGRVLITLGDQDIDLSPSFTIFLSTRDPTVEFPPDICSRQGFTGHHFRSGSPENFQNPDCPKTKRFPSRTPDFNPNWHETGWIYLLVIFEFGFVSRIFIKNFQTFLGVKIEINRNNMTPCQAH